MSCIASSVSARSADGSTRRNVSPPASNVLTPSVVTSRYDVSSAPSGSRSEYANSGDPADTGIPPVTGDQGATRVEPGVRDRTTT